MVEKSIERQEHFFHLEVVLSSICLYYLEREELQVSFEYFKTSLGFDFGNSVTTTVPTGPVLKDSK